MNELVEKGLAAHLRRFETASRDGARLGWKVAFNVRAIQERLGLSGSLVAGLLRRTVHDSAKPYSLAGAVAPALEAEIAVWLARDVNADDVESVVAAAVSHWAPAIELVDFDRPLGELDRVLEEGVFHRAVVFGEPVPVPAGADLGGRSVCVQYGGRTLCEVDARVATGEVGAVLRHLAQLLAPHGHRLAAGDAIILGSMNPFTVAKPGERFDVSVATIGEVSLALTP